MVKVLLNGYEIMLLEFRVKNYKSFVEEMVFSMTPAPKQRDLKDSILEAKGGRKKYKGLCSAVIYGPNAAGKTNIIGAMDVLRYFIVGGDISNTDENYSYNQAMNRLDLIPNNKNEQRDLTIFYIRFITKGLCIEYEIHIDLGFF